MSSHTTPSPSTMHHLARRGSRLGLDALKRGARVADGPSLHRRRGASDRSLGRRASSRATGAVAGPPPAGAPSPRGLAANAAAARATTSDASAVTSKLRSGLDYEIAKGCPNSPGRAFVDFEHFLCEHLARLAQQSDALSPQLCGALSAIHAEAATYGRMDGRARDALLRRLGSALVHAERAGELSTTTTIVPPPTATATATPAPRCETGSSPSFVAATCARSTARSSGCATTRTTPPRPRPPRATRWAATRDSRTPPRPPPRRAAAATPRRRRRSRRR